MLDPGCWILVKGKDNAKTETGDSEGKKLNLAGVRTLRFLICLLPTTYCSLPTATGVVW